MSRLTPPCPVCDAYALAADQPDAVPVVFSFAMQMGSAYTIEFVQSIMCDKHRSKTLIASLGIIQALEIAHGSR
jgi:hypothetical protein